MSSISPSSFNSHTPTSMDDIGGDLFKIFADQCRFQESKSYPDIVAEQQETINAQAAKIADLEFRLRRVSRAAHYYKAQVEKIPATPLAPERQISQDTEAQISPLALTRQPSDSGETIPASQPWGDTTYGFPSPRAASLLVRSASVSLEGSGQT